MINVNVLYKDNQFIEVQKEFNQSVPIEGYPNDFTVTLYYQKGLDRYDVVDLFLFYSGYKQRTDTGYILKFDEGVSGIMNNYAVDLVSVPGASSELEGYRIQCYSETPIDFNTDPRFTFNPDKDIE